VAAPKAASRDGRFIEQLGFYDPRSKRFRIDHTRYEHWVSVGAQASPTVSTLVKKNPAAA